MNAGLIYTYCEVIADRRLADGHRAIYYREDGMGVVETDIIDEGEYLTFSCGSVAEFEEICSSLC